MTKLLVVRAKFSVTTHNFVHNRRITMTNRSKKERCAIISHVLMQYVNEGRLKRGAVKAVAERMGISTRAVEYVSRRFRKSILDPVVNPLNVTRKNGTGRRRKISLDELRAAIKEIPFS